MKPNWLNIWVGSAAVVLVGSEFGATAAACGWAIGGLAHLPAPVAIAIDAVLLLAALAGTVWFARRVIDAEPFFGTAPAGEAHGDTATAGETPA